jgi:heme oxygenase
LEATVKIEAKLDDRAAYQQLLERFLGVYEPVESQLAAQSELAGWGYDAVLRAKAPALHRDLGAMELGEAQIAALPRCPVHPFQSAGEALGAAYVLEGSTLGGQMISRLLATRNPTLPAQFFHGYGEETRDRWGEFVGILLEYGTHASSYQEAASAAEQTFRLFQEWLR